MNDKVKSLFFSQYALQDILVISPNYPNSICENSLGMIEIMNTDSYLLLRDISQLTDEEFEAICRSIGLYHAKVVQRDAECILIVDDSYSVGFYTDGVIVMYKDKKPYWNDIRHLYKSMILYGVLMPFTYLNDQNQPITLTPADIINLGWAKLQSNEQ